MLMIMRMTRAAKRAARTQTTHTQADEVAAARRGAEGARARATNCFFELLHENDAGGEATAAAPRSTSSIRSVSRAAAAPAATDAVMQRCL